MQVHERTLQGDFLMALLRDLVISRREAGNPLKVGPLSLSVVPPFSPQQGACRLLRCIAASCLHIQAQLASNRLP